MKSKHFNTVNLKYILYVLVLISVSGCWNTGASKRTNQFEETLDAYRLMIRWGRYERALNYIRMRESEPRKFDREFYRMIRVTRYDIVDEIGYGKEIEDPREIHIITAIEFLHEDSIKLKSMRYKQVWYYDETEEGWFLDSDLPDFKSALQNNEKI